MDGINHPLTLPQETCGNYFKKRGPRGRGLCTTRFPIPITIYFSLQRYSLSENLQGNISTGLGIGQCMMVILKVVATGRSYSVKLMV